MGPRAQRADKLQRAGRDFKSVTYGPGIKTVTYVIGTGHLCRLARPERFELPTFWFVVQLAFLIVY